MTVTLASRLTGVLSVALLVLAGCGDSLNTGEVTGTVTLDGEPLDNAIVTFSPEAGGPSAIGRTDAQGNYELYRRGDPGAMVGTHKVRVTSVQEADAEEVPEEAEASSDSDAYMQQAMGTRPSAYNMAASQEKIPAKYNQDTTLVETVESGDNVINFDLTSD